MLIYHKEPSGNFGDDLNVELWNHYLGQDIVQSKQIGILGVGTILNSKIVTEQCLDEYSVIVLGSGAGYGKLPDIRRLSVACVRGPITAHLIGMPESACTDPGILAPTLLPPSTTSNKQTVFIPHHFSVAGGLWAEACRVASIKFVDPRLEVLHVLQAIRDAELVITEAMHGAIIADAFRVPWIPAQISPAIYPLKWADWAWAFDVRPEPCHLPPSSPWEGYRHRGIRNDPARNGGGFENWRGATMSSAADIFHDETMIEPLPQVNDRRSLVEIIRPLARAGAYAISRWSSEGYVERAAHALVEASESGQFYLSDDAVHQELRNRLLETIYTTRKNIEGA